MTETAFSGKDFDLLIAGGTVYDGSGSEGFITDVGVIGDRIKVIGDLANASAARTINAKGMAVCPGFIDPHTHCHVDVDKDILHCDNLLRQGITTVISGNCGKSGWPVGAHLDKVDREGFKTNYAMLVGHHTIRRSFMAEREEEVATYEDIKTMQDMVAQGIAEGAIGLTIGYARAYELTDELVEVTRPAAEANTIVASHIRSEGEHFLQAVAEFLEVAQLTGIRAQISHIKADGVDNWDKVDIALALMENAVKRGVDVAADRYPYVASHGGTDVMPLWCHFEARKRGAYEHLKDPDIVERAQKAIRHHVRRIGGPTQYCFTSFAEPDPEVDGKSLLDLMNAWNLDLFDAVIELQSRSWRGGGIGAAVFSMKEENLQRFLQHPLVMIGTDARLVVFGEGSTHPRNYGTFPRVLGRYVREQKLFSLGTAIRKMTSMPAERFRLQDRGWLRPGAYADITIFDPRTVSDNSDFGDVHHYSTGIPYVIVNGNVAVDNEKTSAKHFGKTLRKTS